MKTFMKALVAAATLACSTLDPVRVIPTRSSESSFRTRRGERSTRWRG